MMPLALGTYPGVNPLYTPVAGPAIDLDPNSPTYGQPTGSNLRMPAFPTPDVSTTAKGNAGYPAPGVPTTAAPNAPPPQVVGDEPQGGLGYKWVTPPAAPPANKPAGPSPPPAAPEPPASILRNLKPQVDEHGNAPPAAAPAAAPDSILRNLQPQVDVHGAPIQPMDTGQYLTSATSPGAKAVGTSPVEGFELSPGAQLKIGTATDPMQRVRIAAAEAGVTPDSIIVGHDGRLAAVGENGTPYYLTPQPVFADTSGITKQPPGLFQTTDESGWHPLGTGQEPAYSRAVMPLSPAAPGSFAPSNLVRGGAAELPSVAQNALTVAGGVGGAALDYPTLGVAAGTAAGDLGRQWLANRFDPNVAQAPPYDWSGTARDVAVNALLARGSQFLGGQLAPEFNAWRAAGGAPSPAPSTTLKGGFPSVTPFMPLRRGIDLDFPLGAEGGARLPWETKPEWPQGPVEPAGPSVPLPSSDTDPVTGKPVAPSPGLKTDAQLAAEDSAIPATPPPLRFPLRSQAAIDKYAADTVRWYAQGGNTTPEAGASGNLAEVTGNRGLAALLRSMRDKSGPVANDIGLFEDARDAALRDDLGKISGDADKLEERRTAREQQTAALKARFYQSATTSDVTPTQAVIDKQLQAPEAQEPEVAAALRDVRERLYKHDPVTGKPLTDDEGNPVLEDDPTQLSGLRQSIARAMTRQAQSGRPDYRLASKELSPVLGQLDADIEAGAPDYAGFNQAYREASKPITAMEYLQGRNMVDVQTGTPILSRVQATLDNIRMQRTLKSGWQPADDLSDQQIQQLTDLRDALRRRQNIRAGQSYGSPTQQNIGVDQMTNALTRPATQLGVRAAAGLLGWHQWGDLGFLISQQLEHHLESRFTAAAMGRQQEVYKAITKLLLNRNGEGVAALRQGANPNALLAAP